LLIALVAVSIGYYSHVSAQAPASSIREVLQGTYLDQGYYGSNGLTVVPQTWTAIGAPLAISCAGTTECTVQADMWIQSGGAKAAGDYFEISLYIDGVSTGAFQVVGTTPTDGTFAVGASSQMQGGITSGNHVVQTFFWSTSGASVYNHTSTYRVYKP
jgi:hypothetical protein